MIFQIIDKITNAQFLQRVIVRLMIYAVLANLFLEILFWTSGISWIEIMFTSGFYPLLIVIAFFVGIFIGFEKAFCILLTIIGFYFAIITLAGFTIFILLEYTYFGQ